MIANSKIGFKPSNGCGSLGLFKSHKGISHWLQTPKLPKMSGCLSGRCCRERFAVADSHRHPAVPAMLSKLYTQSAANSRVGFRPRAGEGP